MFLRTKWVQMSDIKNSVDVVCGVLVKQGLILIAKRKTGKILQGMWEFPGGKVEFAESAPEALKRELFEEFEISAEIDELIGENTHDYKFARICLKAFWVRHFSGEFRLKVHDELAWVKPAELLNSELAPADIPLAEKVIRSFALYGKTNY